MAYGYKRKRRYTRRRRYAPRRRSTYRPRRSPFSGLVPNGARPPRRGIPPGLLALSDRVSNDPNFADQLLKVIKSTRYGRSLASKANWWKELGADLLRDWAMPDSGPSTRQLEALASMASWMMGQFRYQNRLAEQYEYSQDPGEFDAVEL